MPLLCLSTHFFFCPPWDNSVSLTWSLSHHLSLYSSHLFIDFYLSSHPSFPFLQAFRVNDMDRCSLHLFSKLSHTINNSCIQRSFSLSLLLCVSGAETHKHTQTACRSLYTWSILDLRSAGWFNGGSKTLHLFSWRLIVERVLISFCWCDSYKQGKNYKYWVKRLMSQ